MRAYQDKVSTHSRPKAAAPLTGNLLTQNIQFQHTAARRRLQADFRSLAQSILFQHTAARRRLRPLYGEVVVFTGVSTHSRPKAAALCCFLRSGRQYCFNTQPPEGGCERINRQQQARESFNTQPPEGGCLHSSPNSSISLMFQHTAARRRLLSVDKWDEDWSEVSTHSRPKAAA